jgi:hypothetical protein
MRRSFCPFLTLVLAGCSTDATMGADSSTDAGASDAGGASAPTTASGADGSSSSSPADSGNMTSGDGSSDSAGSGDPEQSCAAGGQTYCGDVAPGGCSCADGCEQDASCCSDKASVCDEPELEGWGPPWFVSIHAGEVEYDPAMVEQAFDTALDLGVQGVRTDIFWFDIEPSRDSWDETRFSFYTDYVDEARSRGLDVMAILSGAPDWAKDLYASDPDAFFVELDEYVREVVGRVGPQVQRYQLWNEPNHLPDPIATEHDGQLLATIGSIVRELDPGATTYVNVMADIVGWEDHVTGWIEQAGDVIDVIGVDHYPGTWTATLYTDWGPLQTLIDRINNPEDVWYGKRGAILETGFSSWAALVSDQNRQKVWIEESLPVAREMIRAAQDTGSFGIELVNYYQLIDTNTYGEGTGLYETGPEAHFGVVSDQFEYKLGFEALKTEVATYREP